MRDLVEIGMERSQCRLVEVLEVVREDHLVVMLGHTLEARLAHARRHGPAIASALDA